jgi:hypothetical protein
MCGRFRLLEQKPEPMRAILGELMSDPDRKKSEKGTQAFEQA